MAEVYHYHPYGCQALFEISLIFFVNSLKQGDKTGQKNIKLLLKASRIVAKKAIFLLFFIVFLALFTNDYLFNGI